MSVNPLDYFNNIGNTLAGYIIGQNPTTGEIPSQMTYDNQGNLVEASPFVVPPVEETGNFVTFPSTYNVESQFPVPNNMNEGSPANPLMDLETDIEPFELASTNFTANPSSTNVVLEESDITSPNAVLGPPMNIPRTPFELENETFNTDVDYNPYLDTADSIINKSIGVKRYNTSGLGQPNFSVGATAGSTFTPKIDPPPPVDGSGPFVSSPGGLKVLPNFIKNTSESIDDLKNKFPRLNNLLNLGEDKRMLMDMVSNVGSAKFDDEGEMTDPGTGLFGREGGFLSKFGTGQGALSGILGIGGRMLGEGLSEIGENLQDGGYQYSNPFKTGVYRR